MPSQQPSPESRPAPDSLSGLSTNDRLAARGLKHVRVHCQEHDVVRLDNGAVVFTGDVFEISSWLNRAFNEAVSQ